MRLTCGCEFQPIPNSFRAKRVKKCSNHEDPNYKKFDKDGVELVDYENSEELPITFFVEPDFGRHACGDGVNTFPFGHWRLRMKACYCYERNLKDLEHYQEPVE